MSPAASTLRDEMAGDGQRLRAASGQIPMAAHTGLLGEHRLFAVVPRSYLGFMVAGWVEQHEFRPQSVVRVITGSSNWLLTPDGYQRLPREEQPRPPVGSIDGRLDDARWHWMRNCWWVVYADGARAVRILPMTGPPDGVGVVTGIIERVEGEWVELPAEAAADT